MKKLISIVLSLLLVFSLATAAMAATLDTTDVKIEGNTVVIGSGNDAVLKELDSQGKTAKIAVPYDQAEVHVIKDGSEVVSHNWDKEGFIQFAVPGAGTYVINEGALEDLNQQLADGVKEIVLLTFSNVLTSDYVVSDGTVIHGNGNRIQGTGTGKTLKPEGTLRILDLNGMDEIRLEEGDRITFDDHGNAIIKPAVDEDVGYGFVRLTMQIDGKSVTKTYFLAEGEQLTVNRQGAISGNDTFAPGDEDDILPGYRITFDDHDNSHVKGESGKIVARCNGLFDYYTKVTITEADSEEAVKIAKKADGEDITVSGVKISEGSTVLTLESKYLNALDAGTYLLTFHYADGASAEAPLQIIKKAGTADPTNPKTGDPVAAAFAAMAASAGMLAAVWTADKRRGV